MSIPVTAISPERLAQMRLDARRAPTSRFVDPHEIARAKQVLARRGETWAAAVVGRSLERRSLHFPALPWLNEHEPSLPVAADVEEDRARFDAIVRDNPDET